VTSHHAEQHDVTGESPSHHWRKAGVVADFVAQTTAQADERRVLFDFACDLFPFDPEARIRVLDLGAGYGAFAATVLDRFPNATAVGLDISEPMMAVGRERMARFADRFSYHVADLAGGELPADLPGTFDTVVTAAFILHLSGEAKRRMYCEVFRILNPSGCFVDVDLIAPANEEMEAWYRERDERERRRHGDQPEPPHRHALMPHHQLHHHVEAEADQLQQPVITFS
jgi:SAM-dependent methyltransferase